MAYYRHLQDVFRDGPQAAACTNIMNDCQVTSPLHGPSRAVVFLPGKSPANISDSTLWHAGLKDSELGDLAKSLRIWLGLIDTCARELQDLVPYHLSPIDTFPVLA